MEKKNAEFQTIVWEHYRTFGRGDLPWRPPTLKLRNGRAVSPYSVLVSECMLQQTQAGRVAPKYSEFLRCFPTIASLARAMPRDVLVAWQGLGYNRRALTLQGAAQKIVDHHQGRVPRSFTDLVALPGIGPYTAGAIQAFAFNEPVVFIETNIRRAYLDYFFPNQENVKDADIAPFVASTLDTGNVREWYYALMDYGAALGRTFVNANRRSAHYTKQSVFEGSTRQLRARVLRTLLAGRQTEASLVKELDETPQRIARAASSLLKDGIVIRRGDFLRIV